MQSVSPEYLTAITAPVRRIVSQVKITFIDNETIGKLITATAGESDPDLLPASNAVDTKYLIKKMAFADHYDETDPSNRARVYPADDLFPMSSDGGWWGDSYSDVNGSISGGETLTLDYGATPVDIQTMRWIADERLGWPVDFLVETWDGSSWTTRASVTGHAAAMWELTLGAAISIRKMRITITKVNHGFSYAKLLEFEGGLVVDVSDRVVSWDILKERESDGDGSLPYGNVSTNQLTLYLNNADRVFYRKSGSLYAPYLVANRKIAVSCGVIKADETQEILPQGIFYTKEWAATETSVEASVTAWDRSKRMDEENFATSTVLLNKTHAELAMEVGKQFGLGSGEMSIDANANTVVPYGWFESASYWSHLKNLAIAAGGTVYFDELGRLIFESLSYLAGKISPVATISDLTAIIGMDENWQQDSMRNHVVIPVKPLTAAALNETICDLIDPVVVPAGGTKPVKLFFVKSPCIDVQTPVITGGAHLSINSWTAYAWGGMLVLANSAGADESTTSITVEGKPLEELGGVQESVEDAQLILANGRRTYTLPDEAARFVQSQAQAAPLATGLLAGVKDPGARHTTSMRGRPELQLADRITVQDTRLSMNGDAWITRIDLKFDGGLTMETTILEVP